MRPGLFPSQQRALRKALKKADKFDHFRKRTRRSFVLVGALSALSAGAAVWSAIRSVAVQGPPGSLDRWATVAVGPLSELRQRAIPLLGALDGRPEHDPIWQGYHRLVADSTLAPGDTPLRRMLIQVAQRPGSPQAAKDALDVLTARGR
jgi:hypothetical protein